MPRWSLVPLLALACSEYELEPKNEVEAGGSPALAWSPESITQVLCGAGSATVTLRNEGDAALSLTSAEVQGEGWSLAEPFTGLALAPGGTAELALVSGVGEATLVLQSDDPERPQVEIPLLATADQAPVLEVVLPTEGQVLDQGVVHTLVAQVTDAEDPLDALAWAWSSDVDGALGAGLADATGLITVDWSAPDHSEGAHTLTLSVTDSCGNTAEALTTVCQQAGYVEDELDIGAWHFEGAARWVSTDTSGYVELTSASTNLVGSAFNTAQEVDGGDVEIRFQFYIGDGSGADGMSLTALDTSRMTGFLGGTGCGIGYGGDAGCTPGPALPGWSIELDTYDNGAGIEPTWQPHVSFHFDGDVDDPAAWAVMPTVRDGAWHTLEVIVAEPRVTVSIDGTVLLDSDLAGSFDFPAYVGFTAGTGSLTDRHLVDSLEVTRPVCGE